MPDGLVAVVKRDCPTCTLVVPVLRDLAARRAARLLAGRPDLPRRDAAADDTSLDVSFALEIDTVPTLLRLEGGAVTSRTEGWSRERWEALTGLTDLGVDLPDFRPGCGSRTHDPDIADARAVAAMTPRIRSRRLELGGSEDEQEAMFARGWTDGLPVVAPTVERVARMLTGTTRAPDDLVADHSSRSGRVHGREGRGQRGAGGCRPRVPAGRAGAVEAACTDEFNAHGLLATT